MADDIKKTTDAGEFKVSDQPLLAAPPLTSAATPAASPAQTAVNAPPMPHPQNAQDEIEQILKGIPLPEHRLPAREAERSAAQPTPVAPSTTSPQESPQPPTVSTDAPAMTSVRTLTRDVQTAVRESGLSVVRAISMEEAKRHAGSAATALPTPAATARSRRTMGVLFISAILLLLGLGAIASIWWAIQQRGPVSIPSSTSLIFAEQTIALPIHGVSPGTLKTSLGQARSSSGMPLGSIVRIEPLVSATSSDGKEIQRSATIREFLTALGANPPEDLLRALGNRFFFGMHTVNKVAPILVIPVVSYDRAFAGMLAWEHSINAGLTPVYTGIPMLKSDANGLPVERTFEDVILRNYDVRALKDDTGEIIMYYSFPTPNLLIIAESPYTFTEVLSRLQARRQL